MDPGHHEDLCGKALGELRILVEEASHRGNADANAAALATADARGKPSVRTVYITHVEDAGVIFLANSLSGKGRQMEANPCVALCFFWPELQKQVVVEGRVEMMSDEQSDAYWRKRPREAQLGAWASEQTEPLHDSEQLADKLQQAKQEFDQERPPRPDHWRAYVVRPQRVEIWSTGWQRLLARTRYVLESGIWRQSTENP